VRLLLLLLFSFLITSCQKEVAPITPQNGSLASTNISFVYENGNPIDAGSCINPSTNYAIAITLKSNGTIPSNGITTKFTINGLNDEMTFLTDGTKTKKITLVNGKNSAIITDTKQEATINLITSAFEVIP
jgi:hypothetical protein